MDCYRHLITAPPPHACIPYVSNPPVLYPPPLISPFPSPPPPPPPPPPFLPLHHPPQVPQSLPWANITDGHYRYTSDLLTLASMRPPQRITQWLHYHTPVRIDLLEPYLDAHPDRLYATYMAEGLRHGFRIGFTYRRAQIDQSRRTHHPFCNENPQVVSERIQAEVRAGRLLGPLPPNSLPMVHVSPLGLVPKSHQPNKFCLIVDLSSPVGRSVNDGIPSEPCSLKYASVDDAVSIVKALGKGSLLVKDDLKDAYRMIPVHPISLV